MMRPYSPEKQAAAFWSKVDKTGPNGCWLYTGFRKWDGYGWLARSINGAKTKYMTAHRYSWILTYGEPPKGMHIRHKCDTPACCNPAHLELGTHTQNMQDAKARRRHAFGERSSKSKLTYEKVQELRRQYKFVGPRKTNIHELARQFGVSSSAAYAAATGRSWAINERAGPKQNFQRPRRQA